MVDRGIQLVDELVIARVGGVLSAELLRGVSEALRQLRERCSANTRRRVRALRGVDVLCCEGSCSGVKHVA